MDENYSQANNNSFGKRNYRVCYGYEEQEEFSQSGISSAISSILSGGGYRPAHKRPVKRPVRPAAKRVVKRPVRPAAKRVAKRPVRRSSSPANMRFM